MYFIIYHGVMGIILPKGSSFKAILFKENFIFEVFFNFYIPKA